MIFLSEAEAYYVAHHMILHYTLHSVRPSVPSKLNSRIEGYRVYIW